MFKNVVELSTIYTILWSFFLALILTFFSKLCSSKWNKRLILIFVTILSLLFSGSYIYYSLFSTPFTIHVTSMAGQAVEFLSIFLDALRKNIIPLLIFCLPFIVSVILSSKVVVTKNFYYEKRNLIVSIIATYIFILLSLLPFRNLDQSAFHLYFHKIDLNTSIRTFGLITSERIDIQRAIFGFEEKFEFTKNKKSEEPKEYQYNKMNIDFDTLISEESSESIKNVYSYFQNEEATKQNQYTGMYQGKNLIFILAEAFNTVAVSKELTPTLYRLTNSGFHFTNFYSPVFLSTTGGEFQAMTGLIPSNDTLNNWYRGTVYLPFSLGNILSKIGYTPNAYHNWEHTFYNRDKTMPTLGFPYLACENGLENEMDCSWEDYNAPKDADLINTTFNKYATNNPFVTFYITVSGHSPYYLSEEKRNYDAVKDLPYSEFIKGYLASQMDLDQAIEELINNLEEQGILDDTVICLVGDHYPYTIEVDTINEISSYKRDELMEINHSELIIWNNDTEKIEIDKVGSQIDVLPTLLNLFGLEYDSRLMIGHDILSDKEGLAIFSDMSWISDSGSYISKTKEFIPKKDVENDYVTEMNRWVNNSVIISRKIISDNIYEKILKR